MAGEILFKKLKKEHFSLLHKWLNEPHGKRWYDKDQNLIKIEAIIEKYTPYVNETIPKRAYIVFYEEKPIGYIQTYRIDEYPDYSKHIAIDENPPTLDLFIGDRDYLYQGLGVEIIKRFLKDYIFVKEDIDSCVIMPEPKNRSAIRTYEKVGFRHIKTIHLPDAPEPEYVMRLTR